MISIIKKICNGISAGVMIIIGCAVFLACSSKAGSNSVMEVAGAFFFSVALLTICIKGYSLFTGKVGYLPEKHGKEEFSVLLLGLLGNAIATIVLGLAIKYALPNLEVQAHKICSAKLENQEILQTFIRAIFCGVLMQVAVTIYRDNKSIAGILFAIPVFILSGFEHSIADIGYFAISGIVSWKAFLFIWVVILGNSIGSWILPLLGFGFKKANKENDCNNEKKD